jgi:hypothetical protein
MFSQSNFITRRTVVTSSAHSTLRRLHDYEKLSGILWIAWGALQILSICVLFAFGIPVALVGAWNIYAGITRLRVAPRIFAGDSTIPAAFEDMTSLIVIGILNLVFGAVIGVIFVLVDFYVRDQILSHRELFVNTVEVAA